MLNKKLNMTSHSLQFEYDSQSLWQVLNKLDPDAVASLNSRLVQAASAELKNKTKERFAREVPAATHPNKKYNDVLVDAVRQASNLAIKRTLSANYAEGFVHVLGVRDSYSMTFIARFFEGGTKDRGTKDIYRQVRRRKYKEEQVEKVLKSKAKFRGKMPEINFFKSTAEAFDPYQVMQEQMEKYINYLNSL